MELLLPTVKRYRREICWGCEYESPSQDQHNICLMMSTWEFLNKFLNDILSFIENIEVNRIARNRAFENFEYTYNEISMEDTEWKSEWFRIVVCKIFMQLEKI